MIDFITRQIPCSVLSPDSLLPDLSSNRQAAAFKSVIDDFEGLYIGYGARETSYPYRQQNQYTAEKVQDVRIAVLENDALYAEFLVDFGGRLWRLYDKRRKKDVLYTNDVLRLRNLSIRNAWFSGGVEWNCGIIGHSPFTCKRMYCARVQGQNGEEVLRFYEFERVRSIFYQMDFWLEDDRLFNRVHIENPNTETVPMYWWSNMASPEFDGGRIAVPAGSAYNNSDGMGIKKSNIPTDNGIDVSYPKNIPDTIDYFYDIPSDENKFIANIDADGFGLLQTSSTRLKGRKLFSWGHRAGSAHWQKMLTKDAGWYVEIQAGLGKTQYECIPMPPKTHWDFLECYTLADIGAQALTLPYTDFVAAVNRQVNEVGSAAALDARCVQTLHTIAKQSGELVYNGSGYGCLYQRLGGKSPAQLQFTPQEDIAMWLELLGEKESTDAVDFAYGALQEAALTGLLGKPDWRVPYQLALLAFDKRDYARARQYTEQAFIYANNLYLNHLYAYILFCTDDKAYLYFAKKAVCAGRADYTVCERILKLLCEGQDYEELIACYALCGSSVQAHDRIKMYLAYAHLKTGNAQKAQTLLLENGGLSIPDYREGEKFLDMLYREAEHKINGTPIDEVAVPEKFDFIVAKQVYKDE